MVSCRIYLPCRTLIYQCLHIVTCRAFARERLGKQTSNKYATNNTVDPFLGNTRNARTQQ
jgi:hypothetical protein